MHAHPTAVIAAGAQVAEDVEIGPFVIIGDGVRIGSGCRIDGHAQIVNRVEIGKNCEIGSGSVIGGNPQDKGFARGTASGVVIGDGNILREHVTVHRGSQEGSFTRIGNGNFLMVGCHVGHDTVVGDNNTLANHCLLGGHVRIGSSAFIGGGAAFHQFVRVGDLCMVKGLSAVSQDVPPFVLLSGSNQVRGLNKVGMSRAGFSPEARDSVKLAFGVMLRLGLGLEAALERAGSLALTEEARAFVDFFRTPSQKGICHI